MKEYHFTFWQYLSNRDKEFDNNSIEDRIEILKHICLGLIYLQREKISHLDMKPSNMLLIVKKSASGKFVVSFLFLLLNVFANDDFFYSNEVKIVILFFIIVHKLCHNCNYNF